MLTCARRPARPQKFGTFGYQNSDSTLPLLVGYYAVPVMDPTGMKAIVLIQMWYNTIANALAPFNHVSNRRAQTLDVAYRTRHPVGILSSRLRARLVGACFSTFCLALVKDITLSCTRMHR